jgi:hypothetical protein
MTKIALTAAAILVGISTAFAGSDNYGSNKQPVAVDHSTTASISKADAPVQKPMIGADRNLFGH